ELALNLLSLTEDSASDAVLFRGKMAFWLGRGVCNEIFRMHGLLAQAHFPVFLDVKIFPFYWAPLLGSGMFLYFL
ncbi:hypothetical protein, partial [Streptococcus anginosus]|uniref:hypothetical protein n=1 Tax=Streptococcus anginosus TaxID=1328 RepID=UPI002ED9CFA2